MSSFATEKAAPARQRAPQKGNATERLPTAPEDAPLLGTGGNTDAAARLFDGLYDEGHGEHEHYAPEEQGKQKRANLTSVRFSDDAQLIAVGAGKASIQSGTTGLHVTKLAQALCDLGLLAPDKVQGGFDADFGKALKQFQTTHGVPASDKVDKATMVALDKAFVGYSAEAKNLKGIKPSNMPTEGVPYPVGKAPKELTAGTRTLTDEERLAVGKALSTEQQANPTTGKLPDFHEDIGGKNYGTELKKALLSAVDGLLGWAKGEEKNRNAGHMYDWKDVDQAAAESKKATDAVFGAYATGAALKGTGVNPKIKDAWESKEKDLKADPALGDAWAEWRVEKLLNGDENIAALDKRHEAIQSRAAEQAIVKRVQDDVVKTRRDDLILIHKSWPAFASGGNVFVQRIKSPGKDASEDKAKGRNYMWEMFQTVIHEYIHTLEHPKHVKYRKGLDEQKGGFTLREGVTDYFTKVAYNATDRNDTAREKIEGPFHEKGVTHPVADLTTYGESVNAERAAAIVGIQNMAGAFYLGQVELIGKK